MNIKLTVAYDGTPYYGWQKTPDGPSIEGELERILEMILQQPITLQAASRTDRGVHAEGQVVNFIAETREIDLYALQGSLTKLLPSSIAVLKVEQENADFHPSLDVVGKTYLYRLCLGPIEHPLTRHIAWHVPHTLDLESMREAANHLVGRHDFAAFCNLRKFQNYTETVREVTQITLTPTSVGLEITLSGNHFLYKMVRNLVGTLIYVGRGKLEVADIPKILNAKTRPLAGVTAPAHGLSLKQILYPQQCEHGVSCLEKGNL